ncbi:hypothetical protein OUZ56_026454 [Daphnia magna]|uniref:Uncharacterized protein n=1 Tax=Daphnia magna TaxID=35525 RepID=A0ABQ9ZLV9_9CRUS|nr:hypothetical protein OUZ56_026454 [Daphnia magna]
MDRDVNEINEFMKDLANLTDSELSLEERAKIVGLYKQSLPKLSMRAIAAFTGYGVSTNLSRSGRPTVITESDRRYLKLCALYTS